MENSKSLGLIDYLKILIAKKKLIFSLTLLSGLISAIIVFFVLDPIYYSSVIVKTSGKSSGIGALLGANIPDIGGLGELGGGSASKELGLYESILTSRRCVEQILIKYKLNDEWGFKYFQDAIKNFRDNVLEIKKDKVTGIIEIGIYDKDPNRAKDIAEYIVNILNNINIELNVQNAKTNREFIETRYNVSKEELQKSEDSLKIYQDKFGISPDMTVKATLQSSIQLTAEIKSEEIKLDLLKQILTPDQAEVKAQIDKINLLKNQLSQIENSTDPSESLRLKGAPEVVLNYLRLQRDVEIKTKILSYIVPLFEQAKIDEKKEMPSVIIVDQAYVPEKKTKPKRLTIVALSLFSTLIITSLLVLLYKVLFVGFTNKLRT